MSKDDTDAEASSTWEYSLLEMDVSDDASIIALGMGDYAADMGYEGGMVCAFAYSCNKKAWRRLGQDLLIHVSSNHNRRILAVLVPQRPYNGGQGFVEVYVGLVD